MEDSIAREIWILESKIYQHQLLTDQKLIFAVGTAMMRHFKEPSIRAGLINASAHLKYAQRQKLMDILQFDEANL